MGYWILAKTKNIILQYESLKSTFFPHKKKLDEIKYLFYASFMLRLKNRQQFFSDGSQKKI